MTLRKSARVRHRYMPPSPHDTGFILLPAASTAPSRSCQRCKSLWLPAREIFESDAEALYSPPPWVILYLYIKSTPNFRPRNFSLDDLLRAAARHLTVRMTKFAGHAPAARFLDLATCRHGALIDAPMKRATWYAGARLSAEPYCQHFWSRIILIVATSRHGL